MKPPSSHFKTTFSDTTQPLTDAIVKKFPLLVLERRYGSHKDRVAAMLQLSSFTCHTRYISEAYKGKTWNVQYSAGGGCHDADVAATFYCAPSTMESIVAMMPAGSARVTFELGEIAPIYQSYLTSHAIIRDPNTRKTSHAMDWLQVNLGTTFLMC
jgi:hypothetical protein